MRGRYVVAALVLHALVAGLLDEIAEGGARRDAEARRHGAARPAVVVELDLTRSPPRAPAAVVDEQATASAIRERAAPTAPRSAARQRKPAPRPTAEATRPNAPEAPVPRGGVEAPAAAPRRIDLFSPSAISAAAGTATPDVARDRGVTTRAGEGTLAPGTRDARADRAEALERIAALVRRDAGRARVDKGDVPPAWREAERRLTESFRPPLELVKRNSVGRALWKQTIKAWLDGPPKSTPVARGDDPSRLSPPGVLESLGPRSAQIEQAGTAPLFSAAPAAWLRTVVEVVVDERGGIVSIRVAERSGSPRYDRFALGAVRDAIADHGPYDEAASARGHTVVTRWSVDASLQVMPPLTLGFGFDETGTLKKGRTGISKYLSGVYPLQQNVVTKVRLESFEPR